MKAKSTQRPTTILNLGNGRYHFNYNVVEVTEREYTSDTEYTESTAYEYEYIEVGTPDYSNIVEAILAEQYSQSQEFALINKYNSFALGLGKEEDLDKYNDYLHFVKSVKETVKKALSNETEIVAIDINE